MCGLFGFVRATSGPNPECLARAVFALGQRAEQRGRDAAGLALAGPSGCRVVKATGRFTDLWEPAWHIPLVRRAGVVLGHTRHASQGAADRLDNAAPLAAGRLVGTVNGDLDAADFQRRFPHLSAPEGETDSERLLLALDAARGSPRAACGVLAAVRGPAALAWVDTDRPDLVCLARGALCPLAVACDRWDNLWWGSSPAWFRQLDTASGGRHGFHVERVAEGTLLVVAAGEAPGVAAERLFVPTARPGDEDLTGIWVGLDPLDRLAFERDARHVVAPGPRVVAAEDAA